MSPACGHRGCTREADYAIGSGTEPLLRCRWHADAVWRALAPAVAVRRLHDEVPEIDPARERRGLSGPLLLALALVVVVLGFAAIAPVML